MKSNPFRIRLIAGAVILSVLALLGKLYLVQVVSGDDFRLKAEHQYLHQNDIIFNRGSIYFQDKNGVEVAAATLKTGFTVSINPKLVSNPSAEYAQLNALVPVDRTAFLAKAAKKNDPYEEIARRVDDAAGQKLAALDLPGVSLFRDRWRFYPAHTLAADVVGLVGYKGNDLGGRYGLESYYDSLLRRSDNDLYSNFFAEIFGDFQSTIQNKSDLEGDVVTSIEPSVEDYLERELQGVEDTWHSKLSGGIIMDPKTGAIYAMAANPTFDPNTPGDQTSSSIFSNPNVESVFEMGSIIKPLTMAAGIDTGTITPETTYDDSGFLILNGARIANYDNRGRGPNTTMQTVLNDSLNTGASFVALKVGNATFSKYFKAFGLGQKTGIDLPNEAQGLIGNLDSPRDLEHATASFGQGIAMSPIETTRALAALANGGALPSPHVGSRIDYTLGFSKPVPLAPQVQVVKPATAATVTQMLVNVVDQALLGGTVKLAHYSIAAKTGTAQIAKPGGGGYYSDKYLHSFFGYFPAYNPRFIVFLYTVEPQHATYASHTLTQPFIDIAKFLLHYYNIPPDR